ncbi:MFS transporter [Kibdelosporangium philippinense]|uniref:MFS transporter n=1 Tax=Kibdelosporangium philippinense TaxID=211113 RepID=UPI0036201A07
MVTAYTLASAVSTPIWGKLSDLYGRKGMFMASIVVFLIGSALQAHQHDDRTDRVPRGARARSGRPDGRRDGDHGRDGPAAGGVARHRACSRPCMPIAMVGGPFLGGFITDYLDWRWAF